MSSRVSIKIPTPFGNRFRKASESASRTQDSLDDDEDLNSIRDQSPTLSSSSRKGESTPTPTEAKLNSLVGTTLPFTNISELKRIIQQETDILIILGYGVEYIQPTRKSLEALLDYGRDPGVEYKNKVKVVLIDQEMNRKFCNENNLVVGTPILQMYYNSKSVRFRFQDSLVQDTKDLSDNSSMSSSKPKKREKTSKHEDDDLEDFDMGEKGSSKPRNVFISQLHYSIIQALVVLTFDTIEDMGNDTSNEIIVDVDMAILRGDVELDQDAEDKFDSTLSDETDSGEETDDDEDEAAKTLPITASQAQSMDDGDDDDEDDEMSRATNLKN
ncbi:hypothetical protein C9374_011782 [Naegleria lovaniensis]|uniref:Uncharacterized protein n=1 Tax=Naegleria lovaniensis TaxID=51637 RepID=A0AA88GCU8_NAELO|nr:uncharacterized protein C9374_014749 [Naegleria lovaniensis]XP_044543071.1 uncharacterized protein C9374_011782 [Naegleria lovaniensis]KAG2370610.1 hypothetical protein C9374_014749 [Naegleria lovaniensis]KAG2373897.1 hypothetical protein C9374_011782 [Naegleria lovaniensis]